MYPFSDDDLCNKGPDTDAMELTVQGIPGYNARVHFDVNGKWGGHRAAVANFVDDCGDPRKQRSFIYILVGSYGRVGIMGGTGDGRPSRWHVAERLTKALQEGVHTSRLHMAIERAAQPDNREPFRDALTMIASYALRHPDEGVDTVVCLQLLSKIARAQANGTSDELVSAVSELGAAVLNWLNMLQLTV